LHNKFKEVDEELNLKNKKREIQINANNRTMCKFRI